MLNALGYLVAIGLLVCFIMIVIQMFQHGATGMGIVTIVAALCCGIGGLIALIYGWIKGAEWNMENLMIVFTGLFVLYGVLAGVQAPDIYAQVQKQLEQQKQQQGK